MRHPSQHLRALANLSLNSVAHLQKRDRRLANLERAFDFEERHLMTLAEPVGCRRQTAQRFNLIAQKDRGHRQQHQ